jgi:putative ABC transport system permease protein
MSRVKSMNSYLGLVSRYLLHQKKRAFFTATGIMLSVALMTFTLLFIHNLKEIRLQTVERLFGTYHAKLNGLNEEQYRQLPEQPSVQSVGAILRKSNVQLGGGRTSLLAFEGDAAKMLPIEVLQGRLPEHEEEIALAEGMAEALGAQWAPGREIMVEGRQLRLVGMIADAKSSWITGSVAGIVHHEAMGAERNAARTVYVRLKDEFTRTTGDIYAATALLRNGLQIGKERINHNDQWVEALEQYRKPDLPALAILIINGVATVISIYNMFHISVLEKMNQYGILRAIGMSRRQLQRLILSEALTLAGVSIAPGLLIGWAGLRISAALIFDTGALPALSTPWSALMLAASAGLGTTLLAAFRPALAAAKVSPIEALRIASAGMAAPSQTKPSRNRLYLKLLGLSGHLAYRNLMRTKSRFAFTVLSLSVAIMLFISLHYFVSVQDPAASIRQQFLWQSEYYLYAGSTREGRGFDEKVLQAVRELPRVEQVYATQFSYGYTYFSPDRLSKEFRTILETEQKEQENPYARPGLLTSLAKYYFYSDELLEKAKDYVVEGRVDLEALRQGKELLLIQPGPEPQLHLKPGDVLTVGHTQLVDGPKSDNWRFDSKVSEVRIGAILKQFPKHGIFSEGIHIVGHTLRYADFSGGTLYRKLDIKLGEKADRPVIEEKLRELAKGSNGQLVSFEEKVQSVRKEFDQATRLLSAFIVIVTLIGSISVWNTLMTHLYLRSKEFGVMRAIGMSRVQMSRMIRSEGLIYSLHSCWWGGVAGVIVTYAMHPFLMKELPGMLPEWELPWLSCLLAVGGTGLLVLAATILPMRRLGRMPIVETIRYTE